MSYHDAEQSFRRALAALNAEQSVLKGIADGLIKLTLALQGVEEKTDRAQMQKNWDNVPMPPHRR